MKKRLVSLLFVLAASIGAWADEVPGVTVEYIDEGTPAYVEALSAIGRFEFREGVVYVVFRDNTEEELGATSVIGKISFGRVEEDDITKEESTAIEVVEHKVRVTVYPNPAADHVHVDGLADGQTVRLFGSNGSLVYSGTSADIDLSGMASGVYILQVGKEVVKVVKK
ncbi:MAG: T9SS type A sorting domain-containing protein [Bacteroidales bacterium]|nr:T9SS type A sorting domain-containing protein [Bacteroidales bacterium]